ncbi:hypothetical protein J6590_079266 [Homalodisca vitripennis]|nr:hypothetical protein J6590_079266 [Homalodisca vitripennis]
MYPPVSPPPHRARSVTSGKVPASRLQDSTSKARSTEWFRRASRRAPLWHNEEECGGVETPPMHSQDFHQQSWALLGPGKDESHCTNTFFYDLSLGWCNVLGVFQRFQGA